MGELETEAQRTSTEVTSFRRDVAEQLEDTGPVSLELGGQQVDRDPTEPITFKLEGESDWQAGESHAEQGIEFELV